MHIFINELSLDNQFLAMDDFKTSLREVYTILDAINAMNIEKHIFHSELLWCQSVMNGELFSQVFNKLPDKSLQTAFNNILKNKLNSKPWTATRVHQSTDSYKCRKVNVTDTGIAEVAERSYRDGRRKCLLINFSHSRFSSKKFRVLKEGAFRKFVDATSTCDDFGLWTINNGLATPRYDTTSVNPPRDYHSVLSDPIRFAKTNKPPVQGRAVYEELLTGKFYYVDNMHSGQSAHLEIYDSNSKHVGEATLDGRLIPGTTKNRTLNG